MEGGVHGPACSGLAGGAAAAGCRVGVAGDAGSSVLVGTLGLVRTGARPSSKPSSVRMPCTHCHELESDSNL